MRRTFFRLLLNGLTVLSLLLCLASVAMLARSYWVSDWVVHIRSAPPAGGSVRARILQGFTIPGSGRVSYARDVWLADPGDPLQRPNGLSEWGWQPRPAADAPGAGGRGLWGRLGFAFESSGQGWTGGPGSMRVGFPFWLPALLFSIAPAVWLCRRLWRLRRARSAAGFPIGAAPEAPVVPPRLPG